MEVDDLSWLCAELALPVLEETARGVVANSAAVSASHGLASTRAISLVAAASALMGTREAPPVLLDAIAAARRGERRSVVVALDGRSFRLFAMPTGANDRVRLTVSASDPPAPAGLVDIAAAVSHEVANAVGSIRGWADLALHKSDAVVDVRDALTLIRAAARSAEQAARSMLALARGEVEEAAETRCDLSEVGGELLQLLTLTARENRVTLESAIVPALCVRASRAQLFTILFNLVKNAIEACPAGGLVSVRLEGDEQHVRLLVRDTGEGFDAQTRARLFDRYYTTKSTGTGLGLALVRDAVRATGADIEVESDKGQGSLFRVIFPRLTEPSPRDASSVERLASERAPQALQARVLVVDDDHALREMLATALTLRGAEIVSVRSAEEALRLEEPFDIALIDMMLDGCRGDELLARLRQRGVVQAAMLVTGTVQRPRLVPGGEPDDWVRKPFEIPQLVERIRRTLERHRMLHDASSSARM